MSDKALIFNIQKYSIHDGPGIRSVVFFKGCPLRCFWCSNPESQKRAPEQMWDNQRKTHTTVGEYKTVDEIIKEVMRDEIFYEESGGGVTLSGGEVLYQAEFAIELLKALQSNNIHTAVETTGYTKPQVFQEFIKYVDMLYMDLKHHDSIKHFNGTGVKNDLVLSNIQYAIQNHDNLVVRIPIIPNFNDSLEDAEEFGKLLKDIGIKSIELLPFHQFGEKKYEYLDRNYQMQDIPQIHTEDLDKYRDIITSHSIACLVR